jgi:hypothetical protein
VKSEVFNWFNDAVSSLYFAVPDDGMISELERSGSGLSYGAIQEFVWWEGAKEGLKTSG